jgi:hypothetical protein
MVKMEIQLCFRKPSDLEARSNIFTYGRFCGQWDRVLYEGERNGTGYRSGYPGLCKILELIEDNDDVSETDEII